VKRSLLTLALVCLLAGCLSSSRSSGNAPVPAGDVSPKPPVPAVGPAIIFVYQGGPLSKDPRGGSGPAIGFDLARYAGLTHAGVPMDQTGQFSPEEGGRNYIQELADSLGVAIIRASETRYDPGRPGNMWGRINLGKVLLDYSSPGQAGEFISAWRDSLKAPCSGVAFDAEYSILKLTDYPVTVEDRALAHTWGYDIGIRDQYIEFRCREIATIYRLMFREAQRRFPECKIAVVYSGYPGLLWGQEGDVAATYGCDWEMMADPNLEWRGQKLPPITHAQLAWHTTVELPAAARQWVKHAPLKALHTIQLAPQLESPEAYQKQITDRLSLLRPDDGLGLVQLGDQWRIDEPDSLVFQSLGQVLRNLGFLK
jgi:hypothetical protein